MPLVEIKGYGNINLNGYPIEINNVTFGDIDIARSLSYTLSQSGSFTVPTDMFNVGDSFYIEVSTINFVLRGTTQTYSASASGITGTSIIQDTQTISQQGSNRYTLDVLYPKLAFAIGTNQTYTSTVTVSITLGSVSASYTIGVSIAYNAAAETVSISTSLSSSGSSVAKGSVVTKTFRNGRVYGTSTISVLGDPTYIDCDLGEAYKIMNGARVGLNSYIALGSKLPSLSAGSNTITFDNTITSLKVTPRWWKI